MDSDSPEQIVAAYLQAIGRGDFVTARGRLADRGFSYTSPIARFEDADAFIADIARIGPILEGMRPRRSFVDGDEVCSIVDFLTRMDSLRVTPVAHWARVEDGRILRIETFFDATEYARLFETA